MTGRHTAVSTFEWVGCVGLWGGMDSCSGAGSKRPRDPPLELVAAVGGSLVGLTLPLAGAPLPAANLPNIESPQRGTAATARGCNGGGGWTGERVMEERSRGAGGKREGRRFPRWSLTASLHECRDPSRRSLGGSGRQNPRPGHPRGSRGAAVPQRWKARSAGCAALLSPSPPPSCGFRLPVAVARRCRGFSCLPHMGAQCSLIHTARVGLWQICCGRGRSADDAALPEDQ